MIELGLFVAVALLFVVPAAALGIRQLTARSLAARQAAQAERGRAQELQEQAARAERERIDRLWRDHPDIGGLTEYLRFVDLRRGLLDRDHAEAQAHYERRKEDFDALAEEQGGERVSSGHRVLVLGALVLFAVVFCLGVALDYLIFRSLHPGTVLLPLGLACLAVFGVMTGSVIFLGVGRHKLLPASSGQYVRWTLRLFGLMLAGGVALYMTAIAPYRSATAGQVRINRAVSTLQSAQTAVPAMPPIVIEQDLQDVTRARGALREAQRVDQLSAATLAFLEIPLTEGAVLGAELLMFDLARRRRNRAHEEVQRCQGDIAAATNEFANNLMGVLAARGHDETVVADVMWRMRRLERAWTGQPLGPQSLPAQVPGAPPAAAGPAPAAQARPAPAGPAPGQEAPTVTETVIGTPVNSPDVIVIDPDDLAPVTHLTPDEHDQTL